MPRRGYTEFRVSCLEFRVQEKIQQFNSSTIHRFNNLTQFIEQTLNCRYFRAR